MRSDAFYQRTGADGGPAHEPVEFSIEDAMLNTWVEDTGLYLRLDPDADSFEPAPSDTN